MQITEAQRELRIRFAGGFYGQLVCGMIWLVSAALATWTGPQAAIAAVVIGGFFIFPATEALLRLAGGNHDLSAANGLRYLGMQVAFVLPFSMLLLVPICHYRLNLFFPALMILLGAHYIPFVFLYGMRMFAALAAMLIGGGVLVAMTWSSSFSVGAWYGGIVLVIFSALGRAMVERESHPATA